MAKDALSKSSVVGSTARTVGAVPNNRKMISANKKSLFVGLIAYPPVWEPPHLVRILMYRSSSQD